MKSVVVCVALLAFAASISHVTTYVVHPDGARGFPTIRAAIDAVVDSDVIELANGTSTGDGRCVRFRQQAGGQRVPRSWLSRVRKTGQKGVMR